MTRSIRVARAAAGAAAIVVCLSLSGCDLFTSDPVSGTVHLMLGHEADGAAVELNTTTHTSPAGHDYTVSLVEYLITSITLRAEDGSEVTLTPAHYCNDADPATHQVSVEQVPPGRYTGLSFTFGMDGADNVFGNLNRTTDYDNMMWPATAPMGDGTTARYHYMRFEGFYGNGDAFRIHVGPSGGGDYSFDVALPVDLRVDGNEVDVPVVMDLNEWLRNPNTWDFADYGMIMGNPSAQALLQANGESVFSVGSITER